MTKQKRCTASYKSNSDRFEALPPTVTHPYMHQYVSIYGARYAMLQQRCLDNVQLKNKKSISSSSMNSSSIETPIIPRIIELKEGVSSIAVGTIIKTTPARPAMDTAYHSSYEGISYLGAPYDDINGDGDKDEDEKKETKEALSHYCSAGDTIVLEDESGRVELDLTSEMDGGYNLVTGVVVAIEGTVQADGLMVVSAVYFPTTPPQASDEVGAEADADVDMDVDDEGEGEGEDDVNIMFLSGLDCGGTDATLSLKRELLVDFLTGHFSPGQGSNIARVIIAGGGCTKPTRPAGMVPYGDWNASANSSKSNDKEKEKSEDDVTLPIRELDLFLGELCAAGIPVDYIPGLHDPTNANWPQKPLHACLLPNATCFVNMLTRCTNPYDAIIGGKEFIGSDGMNIADLKRYVSKQNDSISTALDEDIDEDDVDENGNIVVPSAPLNKSSGGNALRSFTSVEALELALKFNHIAPTGPDSLPTFPFKDNDPFVFETTPHVFFAGNCNEYESKIVEQKNSDESKKTLLLCVPSFALTGQAVMINLKSLKCTIVEFGDLPKSPLGAGGEKHMEE
uniref:DNA polymerase alpha/delta/epsilon subunit B domain-containing protein n=1 Tax=Chaetoceros debilis TaxID=122233 RepID=A0A7S3QFL3_9STRA|mmetsp:Transcript_12429/g.18680  ORF Transcript_12429/g.18680 Transcript_12429/m.18680 type:complete len:567 (+) Transcript_12429:90-1790(+)